VPIVWRLAQLSVFQRSASARPNNYHGFAKNVEAFVFLAIHA
jgi:hypothetical protein